MRIRSCWSLPEIGSSEEAEIVYYLFKQSVPFYSLVRTLWPRPSVIRGTVTNIHIQDDSKDFFFCCKTTYVSRCETAGVTSQNKARSGPHVLVGKHLPCFIDSARGIIQIKLAMNYFEVFHPVHFRILYVSSITPTTMHTVYLIHMYNIRLLTRFGVSHTIFRENLSIQYSKPSHKQ